MGAWGVGAWGDGTWGGSGTIVPSFTVAPTSPYAGQAVTFTDTSTGSPASWVWTFGDGSTSALQHPVHTFSTPDTYAVTLSAEGNEVTVSVVVRAAIVYGGVELSLATIPRVDRAPICGETDLEDGGLALQGSGRKVRRWTVDCMTDDHTEIDSLDALMGRRLALIVNGAVYPGVMICSPFLETQVTPVTWIYSIGFVQEAIAP